MALGHATHQPHPTTAQGLGLSLWSCGVGWEVVSLLFSFLLLSLHLPSYSVFFFFFIYIVNKYLMAIIYLVLWRLAIALKIIVLQVIG